MAARPSPPVRLTGQEERIILPEQMDISTAESLYDTLREKAASPRTLLLDAEKVSRLTTPCTQIFLSLFRQRDAEDLPVFIMNPSAAMIRAFADTGLTREIEMRSFTYE